MPDEQLSTEAPAEGLRARPSSWYVYLLECADGTFYAGVTTDPLRRLRQHNGELVGGARYTRARRPVTLRYQEPHPDRGSACRREAQIKALRRAAKRALIGRG